MKRVLLIIGISLSAIFMSNVAVGQCSNFTKKKCVPQLSPYIFNGQANAALLNEGDVAELVLTFYANQDYRLLICSENQLGNVEFRMYDTQNTLLFDNKKYNYAKMWDFCSTATQQIRVEIEVPESLNIDSSVKNGCVSILVGFKDK
ncbi:MAG TPA: hypothetical protein PLY32_06095 [Salinivirgaceae bacterium]|nr:hypothetical protein [Salinivirgaceae bacterium]HQA76675.1 hypothetical protein [Salinivirgaceae bacterium]